MKRDKHIGITIDTETLEKFRYITKYDGRSVSGQIMYLIRQNIRTFEDEHGAIELPVEEEK
jgi:hypothetical protein